MKTLMSELLDEIAALKADNAQLRADLKSSRGQHAWATRKARDAENVAGVLKEENARLRGRGRDLEASADNLAISQIADAKVEDDTEQFPNVDPELVALRLLITRLRTEDHEAYAPAICWSLNGVKTITAGLAEATGQLRRIGRRAA